MDQHINSNSPIIIYIVASVNIDLHAIIHPLDPLIDILAILFGHHQELNSFVENLTT